MIERKEILSKLMYQLPYEIEKCKVECKRLFCTQISLFDTLYFSFWLLNW